LPFVKGCADRVNFAVLKYDEMQKTLRYNPLIEFPGVGIITLQSPGFSFKGFDFIL
jgi:hypothetical protein